MPRIAWFVISYAVAVVLAVSMRSAGYDAATACGCAGALFAFGASLGVVQLVHLSPRQSRGFIDGLLSREGVGGSTGVRQGCPNKT
jgi:hypothetical protein